MVSGIQGESDASAVAAPKNGDAPMRQRLPYSSPAITPGPRSVRDGRLAATVRAVSTRATCFSSERTPRVVVPVRAPIAVKEIATTAIAISTSMIVKPALLSPMSERVSWHNFDPSGQPIHTNLVAGTEVRQHNGAAAGHSGWKEANRGERG